MRLGDINRLLNPLRRKIFLLIGRAILAAVDNSETTQLLQVTILKDETISDVERFQEYGFESYPKAGAECFVVFLNGNRSQGIVLSVMDRQYRPDIDEGEIAFYTHENESAGGHRIHFKTGQKIEIFCKEATVNATVKAKVDSPATEVTGGSVELASQDAVKKLLNEDFAGLFDTHVHTDPQGGLTGAPTISSAASDMTANTEAS